MRCERNGLRAQTTTSPLVCEVCDCSVHQNAEGKKTPTSLLVCCLLVAQGALFSVLSLCSHGRVGQEPVTGSDSSVDEFWESCCWSCRATDLLRAGRNPVFVRHHPDSSLLQNQDLQC